MASGLHDLPTGQPESSAVRVALWRALHLMVDAAPHVLEDDVGLKLLAPKEGWRKRSDMNAEATKPFRASILGRARFIEDLVEDEARLGAQQYVILGAGLDTFAQRRPDLVPRLKIFELDQPGPQAWKRQRLVELGYRIPDGLTFVPVDFEKDSWWDRLIAEDFDSRAPAVVASTGVSMYLQRDAVVATLRQAGKLAPGSTFVMSFLVPRELASPEVRHGLSMSERGARASGTPFVSFFTPEEILSSARECGFRDVRHVPSAEIAECYFAARSDGLRPPDVAEELLVART